MVAYGDVMNSGPWSDLEHAQLKLETSGCRVPVGPVGAVDVADPDDPLLMTPVASWKGRRSQMQLPYGVPLAPDRQSHEEQG